MEIREVEFGGGLRIYTTCALGHKLKWESTEFYSKVTTVVGNVPDPVISQCAGPELQQCFGHKWT